VIIKNYELKNNLKKNINLYLLYGSNVGLIEETINNLLKPNFSKNIHNYDESEIIANVDKFKESIVSKSFFDTDKLIIINRVSDKSLIIIEDIIERNIDDLKIILKSGVLEKKSKIRNFFEKNSKTIIVPFYEDTHLTLTKFTQNYLGKEKISISAENINLIIERTKMDRMNLKIELDKIISFSHNKKTISTSDIMRLTNSTENISISELTDMCLVKNHKKTISMLNDSNLSAEDNIIIIRNFIYKLKRLKKIKDNLDISNNVETSLASYKPTIFWKDKDMIKKQLNVFSKRDIENLLRFINDLENLMKKNTNISNLLVSNFIYETLNLSSN
tara:strand:- start:89 stop:1084 length:996 start_codon:yes stop_codon:yes gene_type:complete